MRSELFSDATSLKSLRDSVTASFTVRAIRLSRLNFAASSFRARIHRDPVRLPGFAAVIGKRLLEAA